MPRRRRVHLPRPRRRRRRSRPRRRSPLRPIGVRRRRATARSPPRRTRTASGCRKASVPSSWPRPGNRSPARAIAGTSSRTAAPVSLSTTVGWVYANNSEVPVDGAGGAGALRFAADGHVVDAYSILAGTTWNCAGGATPWEHVAVLRGDPGRPGLGVRPARAGASPAAAGDGHVPPRDGRRRQRSPGVVHDRGRARRPPVPLQAPDVG